MSLRSFVTVMFICLTPAASLAQDLLQSIAGRLQTKPEYLILNIPPRPDAWPGAIFTYDLRLPLVRGRKDDPALSRGDPIEMDVSDLIAMGAGAQGGLAGMFSVAVRAQNAATVTLNSPDLRVVDITYEELKKRVQQSAAAREAARINGRFPLVVIKAYEGTLLLTLTKKANASAEAMGEIKRAAAQARLEASAISDDRFVYKTSGPIVFAFEAMRAKYLPTDGGVELAAIPATTFYAQMLVQQEAEISLFRHRLEVASDALKEGTGMFASSPTPDMEVPRQNPNCRTVWINGVFATLCSQDHPSLSGPMFAPSPYFGDDLPSGRSR